MDGFLESLDFLSGQGEFVLDCGELGFRVNDLPNPGPDLVVHLIPTKRQENKRGFLLMS
jgi:hypothetical protein